jgi:hypothetical protein
MCLLVSFFLQNKGDDFFVGVARTIYLNFPFHMP